MADFKASINLNHDDLKQLVSEAEKRIMEHEILTRDQAILRIKDIRNSLECSHLIDTEARDRLDAAFGSSRMSWGAQLELMAIFDIKEEELK